MLHEMFVAVIDVGAPQGLGFWWNAHAADSHGNSDATTSARQREALATARNEKNFRELIDKIKEAHEKGQKIALGLESPLWIPQTSDFPKYSKARLADSPAREDAPQYFLYPGNTPVDKANLNCGPRAWSAGAGASAALMGLAFASCLFANLRKAFAPEAMPVICTNPADWHEGDILVWEAFVSDGSSNAPKDTEQHDSDAQKVGQAFQTLCKQWEANSRIPNFFVELDDALGGGFAYAEENDSDGIGSFISLIGAALRSAAWPEERLKTDPRRPPVLIRTRKP